MLDIFNTYATDEALENSGAWFPLGEARLLVARAGNKAYSKALTKAVEENRVALNVGDEAADKLSDKIMVDVMADTVLLGYENLTFKKVHMLVTPENSRKMLAVKDFRKLVNEMSASFEAYKAKEEDEQGNA